MITCKQDLINTYIENDHGELRDLYISKAIDLGVKICGGGGFEYLLDKVAIGVRDWGFGAQLEWNNCRFGCAKKLTLSDLKPRTKVEYEKVTLSLSEKSEILESGEWLYLDPDGRSHIDMNYAANWTIGSLRDKEVYRKVERPVEWWDDAVEFIVENACNMNAIARNLADDGLYVEAKMTRDQWCDFARILLEQEGE